MIVLGGGSDGSRERTACAVYAAGLVAGPAIVTGGQWERSIGDRTRFLQGCGIPSGDIRSWEATANTYEEMRALRAFLDASGMRKVILVSDAQHMPRLRHLRRILGLGGGVALRESRIVIRPEFTSVFRAVAAWARELAAYIYHRIKYHD